LWGCPLCDQIADSDILIDDLIEDGIIRIICPYFVEHLERFWAVVLVRAAERGQN
jgi:hypothetical protein